MKWQHPQDWQNGPDGACARNRYQTSGQAFTQGIPICDSTHAPHFQPGVGRGKGSPPSGRRLPEEHSISRAWTEWCAKRRLDGTRAPGVAAVQAPRTGVRHSWRR